MNLTLSVRRAAAALALLACLSLPVYGDQTVQARFERALKAAVIWGWEQQRLLRSAPGLARAHTSRKTIREVLALFSVAVMVVTIAFARKRPSRT